MTLNAKYAARLTISRNYFSLTGTCGVSVSTTAVTLRGE
jgi:hypothetical protein